MYLRTKFLTSGIVGLAMACSTGVAFADSINPTSFAYDLAVGESVTIVKTVTITEAPTSALIDVMFLIDTTGSMGGAIAGAKLAAADILAGLSGFGDLASGVGVFGGGIPSLSTAVPGSPINSDLTTSTATTAAAIAAVTLGTPDNGGDFPERGQDAVKIQADSASWRPGSKRFIIALGDSSWNNDTVTDAAAIAALLGGAGPGDDIELIGLRFSSYSGADSNSDDINFVESVEDLGGTVYATGTDPADITAAILAGIVGSFEEYTTVSVGDLGLSGPEIDVSVVCTGADTGSCSGDAATGTYDRGVERTFTFDVTFTRDAAGDSAFDLFALVDGSSVATEADRFADGGGTGPSPVPLPAAGWLMMIGFGGLAAMRKRKS